MKHLLGTFLGNLAGIIAASYLVTGFSVEPRSASIILAALLTLLHLTLKPLLKLLTWPLILLTLGLGLLIVNGAVLAVLDFISEHLTIRGLEALTLGTLLISGANTVVHFIVAKKPKE